MGEYTCQIWGKTHSSEEMSWVSIEAVVAPDAMDALERLKKLARKHWTHWEIHDFRKL